MIPRDESALRRRCARYGGLAGALLLALVAYRGGVLPGSPPNSTPGSIWRGADGPLILIGWLAGTALLTGAWWALRRDAPPLRWSAVTVGLWLLPLLLAPPLASRDIYSYACQGWVFAAGGDPYGAGVAAQGCPWVESVAVLWRDTPAPYGPVFMLLAGAAAVAGGSLVGTLAVLRLIALAGMVLTAACLPGLARLGGVCPRRAFWLVLACPLVGVHLVSGAHNDAVMVGLVAAGLLLALRSGGRWWALAAGGALLGMAVAVKATAVVVLPFVMLAGVVGGYRLARMLRGGLIVLAAAVGAVLAASALANLGFGWAGALSTSGDLRQWTSPPTAVGFVANYLGRPFDPEFEAVGWTRALAVLLLAVFLVALWFRTLAVLSHPAASGPGAATGAISDTARGMVAGAASGDAAEPRTGAAAVLWGAALAMTATVLASPVVYPWYLVWALVLLAVAARQSTWFLFPAAVAGFLLLPDGANLARFSKAPGAIVITAIAVVLLVRWLRRWRAERNGVGRTVPPPAVRSPR